MNPAMGVEKITFYFFGSHVTINGITKKLFGTNQNDEKEMQEHWSLVEYAKSQIISFDFIEFESFFDVSK